MGWKLHKYTVLGSKNEISAKKLQGFPKEEDDSESGCGWFREQGRWSCLGGCQQIPFINIPGRNEEKCPKGFLNSFWCSDKNWAVLKTHAYFLYTGYILPSFMRITITIIRIPINYRLKCKGVCSKWAVFYNPRALGEVYNSSSTAWLLLCWSWSLWFLHLWSIPRVKVTMQNTSSRDARWLLGCSPKKHGWFKEWTGDFRDYRFKL